MQQKVCLGRFGHLSAVLLTRWRKPLDVRKRSNSIPLNRPRNDEFSVMELTVLPPASLGSKPIRRGVCISIFQPLTWLWFDGRASPPPGMPFPPFLVCNMGIITAWGIVISSKYYEFIYIIWPSALHRVGATLLFLLALL